MLDTGDLLGQGYPLDAAVATGAARDDPDARDRGRKPGWRINVVAGGAEDAAAVEETVALLAGLVALTGQLLQIGGANLGKLPA